jgi:hypothetical protein
VELTVKGANLINNADCTGRQVQAAFYDGNPRYDACAACSFDAREKWTT